MLDVPELAQAGAAVLVSAMATDGWTQLRIRLGRLFGQGDEDSGAAEFDEVHAGVVGASADDVRYLQAELRGALKTRLRDNPELAAAFSALVSEVRDELRTDAQGVAVKQNAYAENHSTVVQAGRDVVQERPTPRG